MKHRYNFTVITPDGDIVSDACKDAAPLMASREFMAKRILKTRFGLKCNIVVLTPANKSDYFSGADSVMSNLTL